MAGEKEYEYQFDDLGGQPDGVDLPTDADEPELLLADEAPEAEQDNAPEADAADAPVSDDIDDDIEANLAAQRDAAGRAEIERLRQEVAELKATRAKEADADELAEIDGQIEKAQADMANAYEEGESKAIAERQRELTRLEIRRQAAEARKEAAPVKQDDTRPQIPKAAYRWLERNPWFYRDGNEQAAATARAVEQALLTRGLDPDSDAFYAALDDAMARRHPGLTGGKAKAPKRNAPPQGPRNGTGAQGAPGNGAVKITAEDKRAMRQFGLDPDNKNHLKEWAREARATGKGMPA